MSAATPEFASLEATLEAHRIRQRDHPLGGAACDQYLVRGAAKQGRRLTPHGVGRGDHRSGAIGIQDGIGFEFTPGLHDPLEYRSRRRPERCGVEIGKPRLEHIVLAVSGDTTGRWLPSGPLPGSRSHAGERSGTEPGDDVAARRRGSRCHAHPLLHP